MLHRMAATIAVCAALLTSLLVPGLGVATAGANENCDLVRRPAATFTITEPSNLKFSIELKLEQNTQATIAATRTLAEFQLTNEGFNAETFAAVMAYFDSVVAWYRYLADPCAPALPYEGPYTDRPAIAGAPYGFGGVDVSVGAPVVMVVTRPEGDASVKVGRVVEDEGPALAHSGSESFVLAYLGAGLLAFGASALGMRRWMSGPLDDHGG